MTEEEVLSAILLNEGGFKNDPEDPADPTNFGITAAVAGEWLNLGRKADAVEMQTLVTKDVAKDIYRKKYIKEPGFTHENFHYEPLRLQCIDYGVNSGPSRAIKDLQRVIGTNPDGVFGPLTKERLDKVVGQWFGLDDTQPRLVNNALVASRIDHIHRGVASGQIDRKYEYGLIHRALSFRLDSQLLGVSSDAKRSNA